MTIRHKLRSAMVLAVLAAAALGPAAQTPVADDLSRSASAMAKIGRASSASFSPDGRMVAFVSGLSGIWQLWSIPVSGGFPIQLTALDDPVGSAEWSPTGEWIAFTLLPGGGLNTQIYLIRPDGSGLRRITDGGQDNNFLGGWTADGSALLLSSNRRDAASTDPYLHDVATGQTRLLRESKGLNGITDVSRDKQLAVVSRLLSRGDNNLYAIRVSDGTQTLLTPHTPPASFGWGELSPDGRTLYITTNAERERSAFARIRLNVDGQPGAAEILAARDDAEAEAAALSRDGSRAALIWNVAGRSELAFLDTATGRVVPGPKLPSEIAGAMSWSADGTRIAMSVFGADAPVDIHVLDVATGRFAQLTRSPHAGVDLKRFVRPELVAYKAQDGLDLSGWLYLPKGTPRPGPVVFSFHGGPESQERPSINPTYQSLLARGIAVFAPNVRGSTGFGRTFVNLDNGPLRVNAVKDIKASVDHLVKLGIADPRRLGIMGGSYGGYLVMAGVTEYPDLFAAGANLFGIVNFETFFKQSQPWMAAVSTVEYGDPNTQSDMLRQLSPITRIDRVKTPLVVLHGANDTNVPVVEAEQVVKSLEARKVPVTYILFPDEGHGWRKTVNQVRSNLEIVNFFEKYLKPS